MPNHLRLSLRPDTDGTAEVFAHVEQVPFCGASSAWFGIGKLREFGQQLQSTFPIVSAAPLCLQGGYWRKSEPTALEQMHLGLRVYPIGGTGIVGVRVTLATPLEERDRPDSQHSVVVELITNYEQLRTFGQAVIALANGQVSYATLEADAGQPFVATDPLQWAPPSSAGW